MPATVSAFRNIQRSLKNLVAGSAALLMLAGAGAVLAGDSSFTAIYSFQDGADGGRPLAPVIVGSDGYLYGTTTLTYVMLNGLFQQAFPGNVFKLTPGGTETPIYYFDQNETTLDGATPDTRVLQGPDGSLYGATQGSINGPCPNCGMVFKIAPNGSESIINTFSSPAFTVLPIGMVSELTLGDDGLLYGTVGSGGSTACGFVYRMTTDGIVDPDWGFVFGSSPSDGCLPVGGLLKASDGNFYGATSGGTVSGISFDSSVFRITPQGQFTTLYHSPGLPGQAAGKLVQGSDGALYGLSDSGGNYSKGSIYRVALDGSVSTAYGFQGANDGFSPYGDLALGSDGALYGANRWTGFFKFMLDGQLTTLGHYGFTGNQAPSTLTADGLGNFYSATPGDGQYGWGTVSLFVPATSDVLASDSISATATTVTLGGSTTISWNSTNAMLCQGYSGGYLFTGPSWNYSNATSGSFVFDTSQYSSYGVGSETFWIECESAWQKWTSKAVTINVVPQPPSVNLSVSPSTINLSDSASLNWSSVNVSSCTASGGWSGSKDVNGSQTIKPKQTGTGTFKLTCTGNDGSTVSSSATLKVAVPPPPTLDFTASDGEFIGRQVPVLLGQSATLSWDTTYAKACEASGAWSGIEPADGSATVTPTAKGSFVYTLTCNGIVSGSVYASVKLVVR